MEGAREGLVRARETVGEAVGVEAVEGVEAGVEEAVGVEQVLWRGAQGYLSPLLRRWLSAHRQWR